METGLSRYAELIVLEESTEVPLATAVLHRAHTHYKAGEGPVDAFSGKFIQAVEDADANLRGGRFSFDDKNLEMLGRTAGTDHGENGIVGEYYLLREH